jgi:D-sedoheptulose 7-phosphate isomerase
MDISLSFLSSIVLKQEILENSDFLNNIEKAITLIVKALHQNKKIHFCGNGGSAADAQHLAAELSGRFYFNRPPLNAEALHCNSSYLTAVANDFGYDEVFSRLLEGSANSGDVLIALSTSGNSANILKTAQVAIQKGVKVISLTGSTGGKLASLSEILLNVPSNDTPRIQEIHILIGHIICEQVEKLMFPNFQ